MTSAPSSCPEKLSTHLQPELDGVAQTRAALWEYVPKT